MTLFSGIGAPEVAFDRLGWQGLAYCEVDPFCCHVMAREYPGRPNLGDVTKLEPDTLTAFGRVDLVCAGWPCQDHSTAGKGEGLDGARSGLFHAAARLVRSLAVHAGLRWAVFENVPGLLSGRAGRDFAQVAQSLVGARVHVPPGGWRSGAAFVGPRGLLECRVLDGRHFGPPQQRKRVFLVLDTGPWHTRPPILLHGEGGQRHADPGARAWGDDTERARARFDDGPGPRRPQWCPDYANTITSNYHRGVDSDLTTTLIADHYRGVHQSQRGELRLTEVLPTICAGGGGTVGQGFPAVCDIAAPYVRKLTPDEGERAFGLPPGRVGGVRIKNRPAGWRPRYSALGNSLMVPAIEYMARRIDAAHKGEL